MGKKFTQVRSSSNLSKGASKGSSGKAAQKARSGLTDDTICREIACEGLATSAGYCRLHYIKNWKKIKKKELILREKKLNRYIEELVSKYPDRYLDAIRQDLSSVQAFEKVISDLDLEEASDEFEGGENSEAMEGLIDHLKRDFDDEGDVY